MEYYDPLSYENNLERKEKFMTKDLMLLKTIIKRIWETVRERKLTLLSTFTHQCC
jgi:hypothetical protein